jgi:hypothetical protein
LLGEELGISTPVMKSLVTLAGVVLQRDFWQSARTPAHLGLAGMDRMAMLEVAGA